MWKKKNIFYANKRVTKTRNIDIPKQNKILPQFHINKKINK